MTRNGISSFLGWVTQLPQQTPFQFQKGSELDKIDNYLSDERELERQLNREISGDG
jgi:hypothetical protein